MPICARKSPYLHPGPKRGHLSTPRRSCAYGHGNGQNGPISGLPPGRVQRSLTRVYSPGQNDGPGPGQRSRTADPPKVAPGPPDKSRPGCEMDPGKIPRRDRVQRSQDRRRQDRPRTTKQSKKVIITSCTFVRI